MKQSCRLAKRVVAASSSSRSENSFHTAIDSSRTSGFSIRLTRPMKRVMSARGMRLVSKKLRSSCCTMLAIAARNVTRLPRGLGS